MSLLSVYNQTLFLMGPWGWAVSGHPWGGTQCSVPGGFLSQPQIIRPQLSDYKVTLFPLSYTQLTHRSLHSAQRKVMNTCLSCSSEYTSPFCSKEIKATWWEDFLHSTLCMSPVFSTIAPFSEAGTGELTPTAARDLTRSLCHLVTFFRPHLTCVPPLSPLQADFPFAFQSLPFLIPHPLPNLHPMFFFPLLPPAVFFFFSEIACPPFFNF